MAGSDFIKTSTGKEPTNATLPVSLVMCRAIREYHEKTGYKVGFKPAGGIRDSKTACAYLALMREELGVEWQKNDLFRIGARARSFDRRLFVAQPRSGPLPRTSTLGFFGSHLVALRLLGFSSGRDLRLCSQAPARC